MRGHRKIKFKIITGLILIFVVGILVYFQRNATKALLSISRASVNALVTVAVNDAVNSVLKDNVTYDDLITVERDNDGNVTSITTNSVKINQISRDTAYLAQANIERTAKSGISVPMGAITGIELLSGLGAKIIVRVEPISSVKYSYSSEFISVGINQTKHSIILNIRADVSIIMSTTTTSFTNESQVLICESVITGKIPDVYLEK